VEKPDQFSRHCSRWKTRSVFEATFPGPNFISVFRSNVINRLIGIKGHVAVPLLPHHGHNGSVLRRSTRLSLGRDKESGQIEQVERAVAQGLSDRRVVLTYARLPSVNRRRSPAAGQLSCRVIWSSIENRLRIAKTKEARFGRRREGPDGT
jgi:hypothetical protein